MFVPFKIPPKHLINEVKEYDILEVITKKLQDIEFKDSKVQVLEEKSPTIEIDNLEKDLK